MARHCTQFISALTIHPFTDGNKRTATETMILFLEKNNFMLETSIAGKVYISLKIANSEMEYDTLVTWPCEHLKEVKEEYYTRYIIRENGKMEKIKVNKKEAQKDIKEILKKDKDFLEIMAKM